MKPSKYQEAIFANVVTTNKNIAVSAGPGSGKTTSLIEIAKLLPYGKRVVFIAFNKSIVNELKERLPQGIDCYTMHSLGWQSIIKSYSGKKWLNENKQVKFIEPFFEKIKNKKTKWSNIYEIKDVMKMVRVTMTSLDKESIEELCVKYALSIKEENIIILIKALNNLYEYNDEEGREDFEADYVDMIEHCVRDKNIKLPQYDFVLTDESQDFSKLDRIFLNKLVKLNGRKFIVGDEKQAIYSFRGADTDSFNNFANEENTVKLPLSISYRCAKNIVKEAKKIYKDIEEFEGNVDGEVIENGRIEDIKEGDFVLCRNSRPLVDVFFRLLDRGMKAYIVGKENEKGLLDLLVQFDGNERTEECVDRLDMPLNNLAKQLESKNITNYLVHPKFIMLYEKINILKLLFTKFLTVSEVEEFVKSIFYDDDRDGVALMTIHKAKGLERDRVFIINKYENKTLIPSPYATTADLKKQEKNLQFVAVTRAKRQLIYLNL